MFNQNKIPPLPYLFPSLPSTAPMSAPSHPHTFSLSHIDGLCFFDYCFIYMHKYITTTR